VARTAKVLFLVGTLLSSACAGTDELAFFGHTVFVLVNHSGERLLYGTNTPGLFGFIESGDSATVGPFSTVRGCQQVPPTAIECLQLFQNEALVYQITPATADRWTLRSYSACTWEYVRTIEPTDLTVVQESERCK